ncbi:G_PROTEIN_RECEP_F1_2 domain-containing protein [Caenorhabditis elegans]|uniref:G_PROTEIN_RECEP_F1_2 domain-containing protein n=1 Tax=Caenorhabditis elegans TaxID=6239 RepID=Q23349_CAEEL|nr:G_PROTEIN_RECEP_F1_2 domain-containing protein [Caenorhabditis elegans]CCD74344.2 G_PROTEIN_RECEP_F1_2 domain-containing protein [Caenorhabditis elegans]|eukprot:NP_001346719.1 Uncharacterized protein CELE_ZC487.2 [Caenorhabditis elegans]
MSDSTSSLLLLSDQASVCFANSSKMIEQTNRTIIGATILVFSLISNFLNVTVITAIINEWSSFRRQIFIQFVFSMITAGTVYTSVNFFVSIPCSFSFCPYLKDDYLMIILSLPNTLSFIAYLLANFGFSIYRLCIVFDIFRHHLKTVQFVTLYLPWILSIYVVIDTTWHGCIKRFNRWSIGYTYNCSNCNVWFGVSFIGVNFYAGQVLPIMMCFMYGIMIVDIFWKKSKGGGKSRRFTAFDIKLAFQYLLVCLVQYLASFLFYIVPKVGNGSTLAIIAMNIIGVIDMGLNPLILLIFNSKVRLATVVLFKFLPCLKVNQPKVATVTIVLMKSTQ